MNQRVTLLLALLGDAEQQHEKVLSIVHALDAQRDDGCDQARCIVEVAVGLCDELVDLTREQEQPIGRMQPTPHEKVSS